MFEGINGVTGADAVSLTELGKINDLLWFIHIILAGLGVGCFDSPCSPAWQCGRLRVFLTWTEQDQTNDGDWNTGTRSIADITVIGHPKSG